MIKHKFWISVYKDYTAAQEFLPKIGFKFYRMVINGIIWHGIIEELGGKTLINFRPIFEKDKATFTQVSEDKLELEIEKENLEKFLFGNYQSIKNNVKLKTGFNNRWVSLFYKHTKSFIVNRLIRDNVLTYLNAASIYIEWGID